MKQANGVRFAMLTAALAVLAGCGGNTAVSTVPTETSVQTTSGTTTEAVHDETTAATEVTAAADTATTTVTTEAAPVTTTTTATTEATSETTTEETTPETKEEQTAEPITEEYDRLGHGIDVKGCEYKELEYSDAIDEADDEKSILLKEFIYAYSPSEMREGMGYCGVKFGGYTSYDFDCDGRDEYIINMQYTNVMGTPVGSCQLYYMEDDGSVTLLHNAAYSIIDLWDFDGLVLFEVHPDHTNGIYGGDREILRAYDGEEPTFVFSSHGDETRFVEESGYIYDYAGHMNGPYYAVVTPELEFLWITRDDLTTDDLMECAKTDTYITDWLNERETTADDVLEAFTVGHIVYCLRIKSDRENGSWYTLTPDGAWEGMQSYISESSEYFIGKQAGAIHGIDLRKLNIIK